MEPGYREFLSQIIQRIDRFPVLCQFKINIGALYRVIFCRLRHMNKPGRLTEEEYATIKTHTTEGARILKGLAIGQDEPLVKVAHAICRWHHERWDGGGYPDRLKGDEIPIACRIYRYRFKRGCRKWNV